MPHTITTLLSIPALRAAVETALDVGVFYQDAFDKACRPAWDAAAPATESRLPDVVLSAEETWLAARPRVDARRAALLSAPRGAWALVRKPLAGGREYFNALIHDGMGEIHERADGWSAPPTFAEVANRMIGMEVYRARHDVERERAIARAVTRLSTLNLAEGSTLRDVEIDGTVYSTGIVEEVFPDTGAVRLFLTKRGSRNRFRSTVSATYLRFRSPAAPRSDSPVQHLELA